MLVTISDVLREAESTHQATLHYANILELHSGQVDAALESLGCRTSRGGNAGIELLDRMSVASQKRLRTLAALETVAESDDFDLGALVFLGCQLIEEHVRSLIVPASAPHGELIIGAMSNKYGTEVLTAWFEGRIRVTMGVLQMLLVAHRRLLKASNVFLLGNLLDEGYKGLLSSKGLEHCLGRIRELRNREVHAESEQCELDDYEDFVAQCFGTRTVRGWCTAGPLPDPPREDMAFLHHHLAHCRPRAGR